MMTNGVQRQSVRATWTHGDSAVPPISAETDFMTRVIGMRLRLRRTGIVILMLATSDAPDGALSRIIHALRT